MLSDPGQPAGVWPGWIQISRPALKRFYAEEFLPHLPGDLVLTKISRIVDRFQLVDETMVSFTHDRGRAGARRRNPMIPSLGSDRTRGARRGRERGSLHARHRPGHCPPAALAAAAGPPRQA